VSTPRSSPPPGGVLIPLEPRPWSDQEHYLLRRDRTTIGRAPECDIRISHPTVSRLHAELAWIDGRPTIRHLSPVNPTLVNGLPIGEPRTLRSGDLIEIAETIVFRLELFGSDDELTEPRHGDERRMYAIVCADVAGYSRLVESDDIGTARQVEACFKAIRGESEIASGRIVQITGDGLVLLFTSAAAAVNSTLAWQRRIADLNAPLAPHRRVEFRAGINSGDLLMTPSGGMHGDAINIAARLQTMSQPGGILVTGVVHELLQGQGDLRFEYIGTEELRNLSRPIRIYRLEM
jgi:class 3 adenylate cyclase